MNFCLPLSGYRRSQIKKRYNIPFEDYGVVLFHPVTSEVDTIGDQAKSLYEELKASNKSFVVISPNNDPGAKKIISAMDILDKHKFRIIPSMRFAHFSELIRNTSAIIGNSSAGVREAPFLGIPSLNIGARQTNRSNAPSIVNASAFDHHGISNFLNNSWGTRFKTHRAFGVGGAADRFLTIIKDEDFWSGHLQKVFKDYKK